MGLESELNDLLELKQKAASAESEVNEKFNQLRNKIINREASTGDKIRDFLISYYHQLSDNNKVGNNLRELDKNINTYQKQQVLVVEKNETITGCTGFGHPGYYVIEEELKIAILDG